MRKVSVDRDTVNRANITERTQSGEMKTEQLPSFVNTVEGLYTQSSGRPTDIIFFFQQESDKQRWAF